ncbi:hypothetical protein FGE12_23010 [Aggregicoccus sp. 17bor-14]|uniref:hypothetical protein n=1 Tax=Myxococcaceae TaxID=31 RepID=UPI00129C9940|nr:MULTISPECIES: hypothetical protein [Myxococcaceae]MBF5045294.1 hypothetical protein [Simulacricoccus sp. 17bor-14]MRI91035.1 hypothetical protein [Aggregicoccus sp. 17bor-14]
MFYPRPPDEADLLRLERLDAMERALGSARAALGASREERSLGNPGEHPADPRDADLAERLEELCADVMDRLLELRARPRP